MIHNSTTQLSWAVSVSRNNFSHFGLTNSRNSEISEVSLVDLDVLTFLCIFGFLSRVSFVCRSFAFKLSFFYLFCLFFFGRMPSSIPRRNMLSCTSPERHSNAQLLSPQRRWDSLPSFRPSALLHPHFRHPSVTLGWVCTCCRRILVIAETGTLVY